MSICDTVSISECRAQLVRLLLINQLQGSVNCIIKVLFLHLPGSILEIHKSTQDIHYPGQYFNWAFCTQA